MLCLVAACGSDTEKQPENREPMIGEVTNLPDAEIKIPATLIGDELADIPVISADGSSPDAPETGSGTVPVQSQDASADGGADPAQSQDASADGDPAASDSDSATDDPERGNAENSGVQNAAPDGEYGQMDEDRNVTYHLDGDTRTRLLNDLARNIQDSIDAILADKYYYPNITDIRVNNDCTEFTIYLSADKPNLYESSLMLSFYTVGDQYQIYSGIPMEDAKTTVVYLRADTGAELARTDSTTVQ
ncbi:MAG: hypothetical protein NC254_10120 [bacterium]|nr:hypothetical protein [bacterium]